MTTADASVVARSRNEITASEAQSHRLEPEADALAIRDLVAEAYVDHMPARVHNYVPVLIVPEVRDILSGRTIAA